MIYNPFWSTFHINFYLSLPPWIYYYQHSELRFSREETLWRILRGYHPPPPLSLFHRLSHPFISSCVHWNRARFHARLDKSRGNKRREGRVRQSVARDKRETSWWRITRCGRSNKVLRETVSRSSAPRFCRPRTEPPFIPFQPSRAGGSQGSDGSSSALLGSRSLDNGAGSTC